jgi:hypothetical protein
MKDKDKLGIDRRRFTYQSHSFEIKINEKMESLYLTFGNYDRFCKAVVKASNNSIDKFRYSEGKKEWFLDTGYAEFCIEKYNNIPDMFDEALLEFEIKKKERIELEIKQEAHKQGLLQFKKKGGWSFRDGTPHK